MVYITPLTMLAWVLRALNSTRRGSHRPGELTCVEKQHRPIQPKRTKPQGRKRSRVGGHVGWARARGAPAGGWQKGLVPLLELL
jgi:hypothetical protein